MVATCFDDTRIVINKAFNQLQPGGWIEFQDVDPDAASFDGTHAETALSQCFAHMHQAGALLGRDFHKAKYYEQWLIEAGFKDVVSILIPWTVGFWPVDPNFKNIGRLSILNFDASFDSFKRLVQMGSGKTTEEVDQLIAQGKRDIRDPAIHSWTPL